MGPDSEGGASKHDPDEHERQRNMQASRNNREGGRERSKKNGDGNDQPDVVCFPDGPDGLIDQRPLLLRVAAESKEAPDPGAEIRNTGEKVKCQRPEERVAQK